MTNRPRLLATVEGYAVEGGYDEAYGPTTCFAPALSLNHIDGPGDAANLWNDFEEAVRLLPPLGFDGIRLTVEWARIEPRQGQVDHSALGRYLEMVRFAESLGLHVTVVLVDQAWPAWLGQEAWLLPWVVPHFVEHVHRVVGALGGPAQNFILFANWAHLLDGFTEASGPPWRRRASDDAYRAQVQLRKMTDLILQDSTIADLLVHEWDVVDADDVKGRETLRDKSERDEIHVRSILQGFGPTRCNAGILIRDGKEFRPR
jgi:beta-glucosidase/6-phospho-beta-glucosidase/beta-galactosidase